MDDQVRMTRGGQSGDSGEPPFFRIVAVLRPVVVETAAGAADHHDPLDRTWQRGDRQPVNGEAACRGGRMGNANLYWIGAIRRTTRPAGERSTISRYLRVGRVRHGN